MLIGTSSEHSDTHQCYNIMGYVYKYPAILWIKNNRGVTGALWRLINVVNGRLNSRTDRHRSVATNNNGGEIYTNSLIVSSFRWTLWLEKRKEIYHSTNTPVRRQWDKIWIRKNCFYILPLQSYCNVGNLCYCYLTPTTKSDNTRIFQERPAPSHQYAFTSPISDKLSNYKRKLQDPDIHDFRSNPRTCDCCSHVFNCNPRLSSLVT